METHEEERRVNSDAKHDLSVIVTVVEGGECLRQCLQALCAQAGDVDIEVIVPYDSSDRSVAALSSELGTVRFLPLDDLGFAAVDSLPSHGHRVIDRCRAVGLAAADGRIVAMLEDRGVPAPGWCRQSVAAHDEGHAVVGGAIENGVDHPLYWALYYCDFGRYGLPRSSGPVSFLSDTNIAYERTTLDSIRHVWGEAYHETTVHWALQERGEVLWLDPRMIVTQMRPLISISQAYRERIDNARLFAETRAAAVSGWQRALLALGTPVLPLVLLLRVASHMARQGRSLRQAMTVLPVTALLLTGTAIGELLGYVTGPARGTPLAHATKREAMKS